MRSNPRRERQSSPRAKVNSRFACAGAVNPGCSSYLGCRAPSIPEGQDLSRSSSNDSSLASVVEENETETTEDYDTGMVSTSAVYQPRTQTPRVMRMNRCDTPLCTLQESLSSAGTPHKRDSFTYSTWLEDSSSSAGATSRGNSGQVRQTWHLETWLWPQRILLYLYMHKWLFQHNYCTGVGKLERGKGADIRIKLERPQDHQSSSVSL